MMKSHFFRVAVSVAAFHFTAGAADMLVETTHTPVSTNEIAAFKTFLKTERASGDNVGNDWVYGSSGKDTEALGMVYEISHDRELLDEMIRFADAALACRNNPTNGRVIWTGKRELCWPNKAENAEDGKYSGSENGDVIAHIGYCAQLILQTPALWTNTVPIGDTNGFGKTYKERALTYVREMDRTLDSFIIPNFVATNLQYRWPESDAYRALGPRYATAPGNPIPWNQQTMLSGGFLRIADCHTLLRDDAVRVRKYHAIIQTNLDWFLSDLHPSERDGHTIYDWGYSAGRHGEDVPHGGYDIWGLCRLFDHGGFNVPASTMTNFANTLRYVVYDEANKDFHMRVDGADGKKAARASVAASWTLLSQYFSDAELYEIVTAANNPPAKRRPLEAAFLLELKQKRFTNAPAATSAGH